MINKNLRTKNLAFTIKNVEIDEEKKLGFVSGLASTFGNKDRDGDVIKQGAFTKSLNNMRAINKMIPVLLSHRFDKQIGGVPSIDVKETAAGLEVTGMMLDLNIQNGKETHSLLKNGFIDSFSIGFSVPDGGFERTKDGLNISEIELFEISIVPVPANPLAMVTDVKAIASDKSGDKPKTKPKKKPKPKASDDEDDDDEDDNKSSDNDDRKKSRYLLLKSLQDTVTMAKLINQDILN